MAESQESEGSDVKSAQDVLKMSGNGELKFGVLIGLIKVGQVSNKEVVDTVLNLVSAFYAWLDVSCFLLFYCLNQRTRLSGLTAKVVVVGGTALTSRRDINRPVV